MDTIEKQI